MDPRQQGRVSGSQHAGRIVKTGRDAGVAALHRLQRHRAKAHQVGPNQPERSGRKEVAHAALRRHGLQPAHGQQQPHHQHRPRHGVAQTDHLHRQPRRQVRTAAQLESQQQRQRHGQHGTDRTQAQAVERPAHKLRPRQGNAIGQQGTQHEQHWQHKAHQHRQPAHQPGQAQSGTPQWHRAGIQHVQPPAAGLGKTQAALRAALQRQQQRHQQQQQGRQLGGSNPVVHGQPGLVDARAEGLNTKVARHTKVSQGLHQGQGRPGSHRRPCQGQGHFQNASAQRRAQQACCLHQMGGSFAQRGPGQQVDIGVQREDKDPGCPAQATHFREHTALQPQAGAQRCLQRPAELQRVGVGVSHHISRHGQRQQQSPFQGAPTRKLEQRHRRSCRQADQHHPNPHQQA